MDFDALHALTLDRQKTPLVALNPSDLEEYAYVPLPDASTSIRLVRFLDQRLEFPDGPKIRPLTINVFPINDPPSYAALSYTWGSPIDDPDWHRDYSAPKEWIVEHHGIYYRIPVGRNLYEALQRLSWLSREDNEYYWIDALSIWQANLPEKSAQVSMMHRIYSSSSIVIVWLGRPEPGDTLERFVAHHNMLEQALRKYALSNGLSDGGNDWRWIEKKLIYDWNADNFRTRLGLQWQDDALSWQEYADWYFRRTWFERAWVLQEFGLAPLLVFIIGEHEMSHSTMVNVASFFRSSGLMSMVYPQIAHVRNWALLLGLEAIRQNWSVRNEAEWRQVWSGSDGGSMTCASYGVFQWTVGALSLTKATDPRDKMFAGLGFLQLTLPADVRPRILVDYELSVRDIYTNATTVLLQELSELSCLEQTASLSDREHGNLPSWVYNPSGGNTFLGPHSGKDRPFNATHRSLNEPLGPCYAFVDAYRLTLRGKRIVNVIAVQAPDSSTLGEILSKSPDDADRIVDALFRRLETCIRGWCSLFESIVSWPYRQSRLEVLWQTCFMLNVKPRSVCSNEAVRDFFIYWTAHALLNEFPSFITALDDLRTIVSEDPCLPNRLDILSYSIRSRVPKTQPIIAADPPKDEGNTGDDELDLRVSHNAYSVYRQTKSDHQRLFTTTSGRMGLGCRDTSAGDQVWLLYGGRVPFILRPVEGEDIFTLVSDAYVHGIMNGEAWDDNEELTPVTLV